MSALGTSSVQSTREQGPRLGKNVTFVRHLAISPRPCHGSNSKRYVKFLRRRCAASCQMSILCTSSHSLRFAMARLSHSFFLIPLPQMIARYPVTWPIHCQKGMTWPRSCNCGLSYAARRRRKQEGVKCYMSFFNRATTRRRGFGKTVPRFGCSMDL